MSTLSKTQRTILLIAMVFAIPYALSWILYANPGWFNLGSRNNGTLISPVITPQQVYFGTADGSRHTTASDADTDQWTLIMFGDSQCDGNCEKTLFTLQQLRKMMGVDKAKIQRAYVALNTTSMAALTSTISKYPGTGIRTATAETQDLLEQTLKIKRGSLDQIILIEDPSGNLVMWYPRDIEPTKVFADIEIFLGRIKGA